MDVDINQPHTMNDDQELAKVLAGVSRANGGGLQFEETGRPAAKATPHPHNTDAVVLPVAHPTGEPIAMSSPQPKIHVKHATVPTRPQTTAGSIQPTQPQPTASAPTAAQAASLDSIKDLAISELRPLIDKLDIAPEEKFDTYLLLIRSTDDKSLIAPAHETALAITDEARRAQALLDIIKEIDYFSSNRK